MHEICQAELPIRPWEDPRLARLPGLLPIETGNWLQVDDAYGAQIAHKQALLATRRGQVLQVMPGAAAGLAELFDLVLEQLRARPDFHLDGDRATCPDGRKVALDPARPLETLAALVQEDFCLLHKPDGAGEHLLTAALLGFPASWTLAEKIGRPLTAIHGPVAEYSPDMARRVQRLFDGVRPERPIWRANCLLYDDPELFQPRPEGTRRALDTSGRLWVRVERQSIVKLEETNDVIFSIHTYVVPLEQFDAQDRAALLARQASGH